MAEYHWLLARACGEQAKNSGFMKGFGLAKRFRQEAEAAITLDSKQIEPRLFLISYYAGVPGIAGGDKKKAQQLADEVSAIDAAWGHLARARVLEESASASDKEVVAARAALYRKALEAAGSPDVRYAALVALVNVFLSPVAQDFDLAERYAREAQRSDPRRVGPYTGLAVAYASRGKWTELDATLDEAEEAVPGDLAPHYQAGRIIFLNGSDYARAERYFRKFLAEEPEPGPVTLAHAHWRLGLTLEKLGKRAEAIAELEQATRLEPDFEDAEKDLRRMSSMSRR